MLKERIQEVFDFTKSESPYRKANKGWINQDIFLDLSPSADTYKQTNEAAKVTLFWTPLNSLFSKIFLIIILGSLLVFTSVSFAKGRFDFNLFNNSEVNDILKVDQNKAQDISILKDIESTNSTIQKNLETKDLDKSTEVSSLDDNLKRADEKIINKKIDKQVTSIKATEKDKDIKILQNKKPKSNFI
ncbi:hypothetical protein [Prochlorococcus sp. MIT 0801]|uniref:hypothetical protein n=1 Tax=Prochlorococcus sp. MIT 0801 TaxID=1501269 RepID=UPI0004F730AB|nr:hypothetical protein [Prochlorococcus sp. MIT 0801]AIQ98124.1 hypothetical protein EW15_2032 [Prochlorococcus sp. MIT 0801]